MESAARTLSGRPSPSRAVLAAAPCTQRRRDGENGLAVVRTLHMASSPLCVKACGPDRGWSRPRPHSDARRDAVLVRRAVEERGGDLRAIDDDAEVGGDVVERGFLFAGPGRRHTVLRNDHLVAEKEGVVDRRAYADVGDHPDDHQRVHLEVAQREVQIRAEEGRVPALDDIDVLGPRIQILDHAGAPALFEAMRRAFEELAVLPNIPAVRVDDEEDCGARPSSRVYDPLLRRHEAFGAGQHHRPARLAELVEHVDDNDAGAPWVDEDLTLQLFGGKDVDGHGCPPQKPDPLPAAIIDSPDDRVNFGLPPGAPNGSAAQGRGRQTPRRIEEAPGERPAGSGTGGLASRRRGGSGSGGPAG